MINDNTPDTDPNPSPSTSDAIADFVAAMEPLVTRLQASLESISPAMSKSHATVGPKQMQVIPMATAMMRTTPDLSGVSSDRVDAVVADAAACAGLSQQLKLLAAILDQTGRLRLEYGWHVVSGAIATAHKHAPLDLEVAMTVAKIDAVTARGPRDEQAAHAAVTAQAQATKAAERAAKANEKLAAATARATALQQATGGAPVR